VEKKKVHKNSAQKSASQKTIASHQASQKPNHHDMIVKKQKLNDEAALIKKRLEEEACECCPQADKKKELKGPQKPAHHFKYM